MKKFIFYYFLLLSIPVFSQIESDSTEFRKIAHEILNKGKGYEDLRVLTKDIGHRLSGTEAYEEAVRWGVSTLKLAGADTTWLQPVIVPVWKRGIESLMIKSENGKWRSVKMLSLGNSEGTMGKDLTAEIIVVNSFDEFEKLSDNEVKGKMVLFNYAFNQDFIHTGEGYGDAVKYRWATPSIVAKKGGVAVLIRSTSTAFDDVPHTGTTHYDKDVAKIPAVALGPKTADDLANLARSHKIYAKLNSASRMLPDKLTFQVIGEIKGKVDDHIITVGGHLDSWDVGEGAQDDGAGIVQSIEVLRTFKALGIRPNHTIRAVLFANEENGSRGALAYLDSAKARNEIHIFALESDIGGYSPRGFTLDMSNEKSKEIKKWSYLFRPYFSDLFVDSYSGEDVGRLKQIGAATAGLMPDSQRYFDLHHSESDVFEAVNRRELLLGATVMTQLIYLVDKYW